MEDEACEQIFFKKMVAPLLFWSCFLTFLFREIPNAAYTLAPSEYVSDGQTLISEGATFKLGFFSPSNSKNRYLGIWYNTIPVKTVVWVANRNSPLHDKSGVLKIDSSTGNIIIVNETDITIWSSNTSKAVKRPIIEFLESGNLVLRDKSNGDTESYAWQSFDYFCDTLLPGMKLGWDLKNGINRIMSSWKSPDDPSRGDFTYEIDLTAYPEAVMRNHSSKYYRAGPWNGFRHSGSPDLQPNPVFDYVFIQKAEEVYYMYQLVNKSVLSRLVLTQIGTEGHLERYTWLEHTEIWNRQLQIPRDACDTYSKCGSYGTCDTITVPVCQCLRGFKPKSLEDWNKMDGSQGCERQTPVNCTAGDGFWKYTGVKLPDTTSSWVNTSMNLMECRAKCLKNCSCMAYTNSDIRGRGSGCVLWFSDLIDIRQWNNAGQDLYIRMASSEQDIKGISRTVKHLILTLSISSGIVLLGLGGWCIWKKKNQKGNSVRGDVKLPLFDLVTIAASTNNFSEENKLGQGGFGTVYKGILKGKQEIAVKRLSKNSKQGVEEFTNEVLLISELQHKNLVKLLGCCVQGEEKMLVYEFMQNKSLDLFIFDEKKCRLLDWQKRFDIILGVARGLDYLHHDSRLRIIHRDLKAANILLDSEMIPKISDFGMARIFSEDQMESFTKTVCGTHGYMSPEYMVDGHFSMKSDVFSFGVIVLEIISGKKNWRFSHPDHALNLLGHAWRLWNEDKSMELVDQCIIINSCIIEDILRCIHIGLLCVQEGTDHRPTMSSVVLMVRTATTVLPKPQPPGFYIGRNLINANSSSSDNKPSTSNEITISLVDGR